MLNKKSHLIWRCRRGIKEMDIIFQDFIKNSYDQLSNSNKNAFSKLLDQQDLDILNWIIGKDNPRDSELVEIISIIKSSRKHIKA